MADSACLDTLLPLAVADGLGGPLVLPPWSPDLVLKLTELLWVSRRDS